MATSFRVGEAEPDLERQEQPELRTVEPPRGSRAAVFSHLVDGLGAKKAASEESRGGKGLGRIALEIALKPRVNRDEHPALLPVDDRRWEQVCHRGLEHELLDAAAELQAGGRLPRAFRDLSLEERREGDEPVGGRHLLDLYEDAVPALVKQVDCLQLVEEALLSAVAEMRRERRPERLGGLDLRGQIGREQPREIVVQFLVRPQVGAFARAGERVVPFGEDHRDVLGTAEAGIAPLPVHHPPKAVVRGARREQVVGHRQRISDGVVQEVDRLGQRLDHGRRRTCKRGTRRRGQM